LTQIKEEGETVINKHLMFTEYMEASDRGHHHKW